MNPEDINITGEWHREPKHTPIFHIETDFQIPLPTLHPFTPRHRLGCAFCGSSDATLRRRIQNWVRTLWGKRAASGFGVTLCRGNKPPSEDRNAMSNLGALTFTQEHGCSGLQERHIHVLCGGCGAEWYMETAEKWWLEKEGRG